MAGVQGGIGLAERKVQVPAKVLGAIINLFHNPRPEGAKTEIGKEYNIESRGA